MICQLLLLYLHCSLIFPATWHLFVCTVDDYMKQRWITVLEWTVMLEVVLLAALNGASWRATWLRSLLSLVSAAALIWGRQRAQRHPGIVTTTLRFYSYYIISAILVCSILGTANPYIGSDMLRVYGLPIGCWLLSPLFGLYGDQLLILTTSILTLTTWDAVLAYALGTGFKASHFVVLFGHPYPFKALCMSLALWVGGWRVHSLRHKQHISYQQLPQASFETVIS